MIGGLGTTELIIILVIVVVLFGVGRIGKIAGEMGSGIRAFKEGIQGNEEEDDGEKPESEAAEESQEEESKT
jgi:sec-independent protein translocase protein TatA